MMAMGANPEITNHSMHRESYEAGKSTFPVGPREDFQRLRHKIEAQAVAGPVLVQVYDGKEFTVPRAASADEIQRQYDDINRTSERE